MIRFQTFSNRPKRPQVPHTIYRLKESSRKLWQVAFILKKVIFLNLYTKALYALIINFLISYLLFVYKKIFFFWVEILKQELQNDLDIFSEHK